jgi:hypothetical protein
MLNNLKFKISLIIRNFNLRQLVRPLFRRAACGQQKFLEISFFLKVLVFTTIFLFSITVLCSAGSGVLISVVGKVEIISGGKTATANQGRALVSGDLIKSFGGTAVLVLASGKTQTIKDSQEYRLSEGSSKKNGLGARLTSALSEVKKVGKGPFIRGMVRAGGGFKILYPSNSSILPGHLKFDWIGRENTAEAKIVVKSEDSDFNDSFSPNLDAETITWPETGPKIVPGRRYYWKITGMNMESMEESSSNLRWFRILTLSETDELKKGLQQITSMKDIQPSDKFLLKAALFYSFRLDHNVLNLLQSTQSSGQLSESAGELLVAVEKRMAGI